MTTRSHHDHEWLRLADGEEVIWSSQPRLVAALPAAGFGILLTVGVVVGATVSNVLFVALAPVGLSIAAWALLSNRRTWFVLTTKMIYVRTGVLGRRLKSVEYHRVQNSAYQQSITGVIFGHGRVSIELADQSTVTFRAIYDPAAVESMINDHVSRERDGSVPGTTAQWNAILEEVRALRRTLETAN